MPTVDWEDLTERELDVLRLAAHAFSNREIASALGLSVKTVEIHKAKGMRRLGLSGRRELLQFALKHGWLDQER